MSKKEEHVPKIKLPEVAKFKFSFPLTREGTQIAEHIKMTKTKQD